MQHTNPANQKKAVAITLVVAAVVIFILSGFYSVSSTQRGVIATFGKIKPEVIEAGLHIKIPFVQTIHKMSIQTVKLEENAPSYTKDIQTADVEDEIPVNSILREFIGGCCFYKDED